MEAGSSACVNKSHREETISRAGGRFQRQDFWTQIPNCRASPVSPICGTLDTRADDSRKKLYTLFFWEEGSNKKVVKSSLKTQWACHLNLDGCQEIQARQVLAGCIRC